MTTSDVAPDATAPERLLLAQVRPRLLMVDDEPIDIQTLYQAFAADHQVFIATDGEQALALCASKRPDLVLLDVEMPGMDGYEVCRRLKADPVLRDTPVIFVTAMGAIGDEERGLELTGRQHFPAGSPLDERVVVGRASIEKVAQHGRIGLVEHDGFWIVRQRPVGRFGGELQHRPI